jgi:hypothetical protein
MPGVLAVFAQFAWAAGQVAVRWNEPIEIATGRGEKGPWRQNDSRYDYVDDATVAFTGDGGIALAWVDQKQKDVMFQLLRPNGQRAGAVVNVSRSARTFSWLPRIVVAPDNPRKLYLLWQEIIFSGGSHGGDILFARSEDGGLSFAPPLNLSRSRGGDGKGRIDRDTWSNGSLDLVITSDGTVLAAWTEYDGALWLARSRDKGASFGPPRRLAGDAVRPARAPALATGPGGAVYLAWTVGEDVAADIRVVQSGDGGATFGEPQLAGAGRGHADAPRLTVDPRGTLHLVYAESEGGPAGRYQIRYVRSTSGAAGFGQARTLSAPGPTGAAYPALALDARGALYVSWEVFPAPGERPRGLAFTWSRDGGEHFATPALVPGSRDPGDGYNGSNQGLLGKKIAASGDGSIAVVNSSLEPGERSRVWLIRGQVAGSGNPK